MTKKRTLAEINRDYKLCKKYVDEHPNVSSLKEIADAVHLSESQVKTSLSRHPRVSKSISKQIIENQKAIRLQKADLKKAEKVASLNTSHNSDEDNPNAFLGFVIDASITGISGILDTIKKICDTTDKIILTSITIKELEKLQKFTDSKGNDARRILALAAGNYVDFECVLIDETLETPDDCIIKYCADHKDSVILLTSDKTMDLKARTYGIKTQFFKHENDTSTPICRHFYTYPSGAQTLHIARRVGGKLFISDFGNESRSVRVISNNIEYNSGVIELKIGDDIYVATKKDNYMTFAHYKIISLSAENNCNVIYSKRLYNLSVINDLPKAGYRSFMRDFKSKIS